MSFYARSSSSGLPPERLELEITESVLIESHVDVLSVIRQLKNIGVSIALDDFGTGYSSLSYLTMFPFDKIKIDRSFTQNMTKRSECAAIVSSVLALGRGLGTVTTAEGVETEEQFELLRASGVNTVQGYLFGRPCPVSEIELGSKFHRPSRGGCRLMLNRTGPPPSSCPPSMRKQDHEYAAGTA